MEISSFGKYHVLRIVYGNFKFLTSIILWNVIGNFEFYGKFPTLNATGNLKLHDEFHAPEFCTFLDV